MNRATRAHYRASINRWLSYMDGYINDFDADACYMNQSKTIEYCILQIEERVKEYEYLCQ